MATTKKVQTIEPKKTTKTATEKKTVQKTTKTTRHAVNPKTKKEIDDAMNKPVKAEVEKIPDSDVVVISKEETDMFNKLDSTIRQGMESVEKTSLDIAFAIFQIQQRGLFKVEGYKNIYDYCASKYGIARGTVNNFTQIVCRFGERIENGTTVENKICDKYASFSSSKLIVMHGFSDEELSDITPDMSVRQIKAKLDEIKPKKISDSLKEEKKEKSSAETSEEEPTVTVPPYNKVFTFNNLDVFGADSDSTDAQLEKLQAQFNETITTILVLMGKGHTISIVDEP